MGAEEFSALVFVPMSTPRGQPRPLRGMTAVVKGFGCRAVVTYPRVLRAGVRKPPRKEPAGAGWTASGLWGFDGAAAWGGGCAGWGNRQRINDRGGEFGTAATIDGRF